MIEYLYNAIRASAGTNLTIAANVIDESGNKITEDLELIIHLDDHKMLTVDGYFQQDMMLFEIPAAMTEGLEGKYWYCIKHLDEQLCFKQPIYFV